MYMYRNSTKLIPSLLASLMLITIFSGRSLAQCAANSNCTPLTETFGSTTTASCPSTQVDAANPYVVNSTFKDYSSAPGSVGDGSYGIRCDGDKSNGGWYGGGGGTSMADNTSDPVGQAGDFLLMNSGPATGKSNEFYHRTISNLCATATYNLTFYAGNLSLSFPTPPSLSVYNFSAGTPVQSCTSGSCPSSFNTAGGTSIGSTGTIPLTSPAFVWKQYSYNFTPGATSFDLIFVDNIGYSGTGNDFAIDDITITYVSGGGVSCSPLPVELISFTAEEFSQNALLKWSTTSEKDLSYFSVEKSEDGIYYSEIGKVSSAGSASVSAHYEFRDFNFFATSYYRLKMVDLNGSTKYSNIAVCSIGTGKYCKVYKKESGELEIRVNIQQSGSIKAAFYSILGQKYAEEEINLQEGTNIIVKDFHLENKNVLVRIIASDGEVLYSGMIADF
jgi:hypothetical protein